MPPTDDHTRPNPDIPSEFDAGRSSERMDEFVRLLGLNQRRLFLFLKSRLPTGNDADDLLQETNLILWREFDSFESGTNFAAWAYRIADNQIRAARKRKHRDRLVFSDAFLDAVSTELTIEFEYLERRSLALDACLQRLPPHHRELIERRYGSASAIDSLASQLKKNADAVYRMLSRIRHTLHECVTNSLAKGES